MPKYLKLVTKTNVQELIKPKGSQVKSHPEKDSEHVQLYERDAFLKS